jgi:hypothetical protein
VASRVISESRSGVRSVSTMICHVSIGFMATRARRITPVRPMPPAVAQNRSGSCCGPTRWTWPSAVSRSSQRTCCEKLPAMWWFSPWMSAAMAPPTVTYRVPAVTGTNRPIGTNRFMSRSSEIPASTSPAARSTSRMRSAVVMSSTRPPAFCAASPVAAGQPAGEHATAGTGGQQLRRLVNAMERRRARQCRGGAPPSGERDVVCSGGQVRHRRPPARRRRPRGGPAGSGTPATPQPPTTTKAPPQRAARTRDRA